MLEDKLEPIQDKLKEGPGKTPTAIAFSSAMVAAKKMQKKIHDQLRVSANNIRNAFEMHYLVRVHKDHLLLIKNILTGMMMENMTRCLKQSHK